MRGCASRRSCVVRAFAARRHSTTAQATCTTSEAMSPARSTHSSPSCGSNGSPIVRRCSAYSLKASWPLNALRLPYMCTSTNPMKMTPLAAMSSFSAIVDRAALAPVTRPVV